MSDYKPGLEGVIAFESEIAEPDKDGGALRYRGVDIEELTGHVSFGHVWGLLVDNSFTPGLAPAENYPLQIHSGDVRVDVQSAVAMLAPAWGIRQLLDISDEQARDDLARVSVTALSFVAQSARGLSLPLVPQREVDKGKTIPERFMIRWRGDPDPRHVKAVDAYWVSAAEHGMNASTFTGRIIASTGADVAAAMSGAAGAMSGPLHGGAPARVLHMIEEVERTGDAETYVKQLARPRRPADGLRAPRVPGRGPARPGAAAHRQGTGRPPLRSGPGAGERGAGRAPRTPGRPGAGDQRGVLGRDRPRLRRGSRRHVHLDVHLRAHRGMVGAHPGAEARPASWSGRAHGTSARRPARRATYPARARFSARSRLPPYAGRPGFWPGRPGARAARRLPAAGPGRSGAADRLTA